MYFIQKDRDIPSKEAIGAICNLLQVKRLSPIATLPTTAYDLAAGYDLYSPVTITIPPWSQVLIKTDIAIRVPTGTYGRLAPRSGLAMKGIHIGGGVIDESYTGNVGVIMCNMSDTPFDVIQGSKICQLILEQIRKVEILEVDTLMETERGDKGFGSSGH
jgi:deoxyuridine 5'-triphosphate nucleotidohydrolase